MSAPRIAIATNNGDIGGGEVMLLNIAEALAALGMDVAVIGPTSPSDVVDRARERGLRTIPLPASSRRGYTAALARWRLRHRHIPLWCNGLVPSFATAGMGPRIVHLHIAPEGPNSFAARVAALGARRVLVPSEYMATRVPGSTVLPNWTEEITYRPRVRDHGGPIRIGFLGRLTLDKGVDVLADAVRMLVERTELDLRLVLAGENRFGNAQDDAVIESALSPIADRVERLGWIDRKTFFGRIDLAVFPSRWQEPFGLVAAEAMAAGVPFVISKSGALPDVAGPGHPWIAERGDAEDLAQVLEDAVRELDHVASGKLSARRRWERLYSPAAGHAAVRELLIDIAHDRRTSGVRRTGHHELA